MQNRNFAPTYCSSGSSRLTCFHGTRAADIGRDSLCIAQGALFNRQNNKYAVDCEVRRPERTQLKQGITAFEEMKEHWYETGAPIVFNRVVDIGLGLISNDQPGTVNSDAASSPRYTVLIKREGNTNFWHNLMEIWSMAYSLDVLRMSRENTSAEDPSSDASRPLLTTSALAHDTQVVVVDDEPEGPLYELWSLLTGSHPVRLSAIRDEPDKYEHLVSGLQNIIVPLPGAANPLWQNDWDDRDCTTSVNLKVFIDRIKRHYDLPAPKKSSSWFKRKLELTLIDRKGSRKLVGADQLLRVIQSKFPEVNAKMVDLGDMSFTEQLKLIQQTDILVGVHGAGLTHTMFMRPGHGAVIEIRPPEMDHKGFKNLAKMMGIHYYTTRGELVTGKGKSKRDEWHFADISVEETSLMELVQEAVKTLSEEGKSS
ncbi:hypothetical protein KVR01_009455 [Diaporthe batatas]|uniref:uncharacterized protein n=1 Tax=Diaporthe batatas TaxID=748121 RepID=UPI001D05B587|nr:uncharacterized protein KVR01_009455 [Diaporthe batatas]KAG8161191.1 hypothetical protein KVR01_009455 [Diaporthe batatas]